MDIKDRVDEGIQKAREPLWSSMRDPLRGEFPTRPNALLRGLSVLYSCGLWLRERRTPRGKRLPCPVISIGNITVGGTGKTPLTLHLAELLIKRGRNVGILSRGYGRKGREGGLLVVSERGRLLANLKEAGDEPYLMAQRLSGASVIVCADRYRAGLVAIERCGSDLLLLDDGFQHIRLHRDLNIVLMDCRRPFGNGYLLPAGPMREPASALKRADVIILSKVFDQKDMERARRLIEPYAEGIMVLGCRYAVRSIMNLRGDGTLSPQGLEGLRVGVLCGIADPRGFISTLQALGVRITKSLFLPDHYWYTQQDLITLKGLLRGCEVLLTTEKDAVKLRGVVKEDLPIWVIVIEVVLDEEDELLRIALSRRGGAA